MARYVVINLLDQPTLQATNRSQVSRHGAFMASHTADHGHICAARKVCPDARSSGEALPTMAGPSEVLRPFVVVAAEVWKQPRGRAVLSVSAGADPPATVRITVRFEGPRVARAEGEGGCQSM
jgi:hypothetical protein